MMWLCLIFIQSAISQVLYCILNDCLCLVLSSPSHTHTQTNHTNYVRPNTVDKKYIINVVVLATCFSCGCHHRANVSVRKLISKYSDSRITIRLYCLNREMITTWWLLKPKHMTKILTRIVQAVMNVLILYITITYLFKYCTKECVN